MKCTTRCRELPIAEMGLILLLISEIAGCGSCSQRGEKAAGPQKTEVEQITKTQLKSEPMEKQQASSQTHKVRASALAGSWYPRSPDALRDSIEDYLGKAGNTASDEPLAMIVPHAGHSYSGAVAATAYAAVKGKSYRRVFILAPNHTVSLIGAAVPSVTHFETPLGQVPIDTQVTQELAKRAGYAMDDRPHQREHAIEIQLPFVQVALTAGYQLVPIVVGEIDLEDTRRMAKDLRPFINSKDLVIISSDFTHYGARFGYVPFSKDVEENLKKLDLGAFEQIKKHSLKGLEKYKKETDISVCGYHPILLLLALLPEKSEFKLLQYDTSGNMTNDFSNSVSYLSAAAYGPSWDESIYAHLDLPRATLVGGPEVLTPLEQQVALKLARAAVEKYVRMGKTLQPEELGIQLTEVFQQNFGVFVTLKKNHELRGCIGNIWPAGPLITGLIGRAADAAAHDRRFEPVRKEELKELEVEVSVLTQPTRVNSYNDIEIGRHGIVVLKHGRSAVYLPQVAPEQGWNLEQTLNHLSAKAGLQSDAWRQGAAFEVFEAQVFKEE